MPGDHHDGGDDIDLDQCPGDEPPRGHHYVHLYDDLYLLVVDHHTAVLDDDDYQSNFHQYVDYDLDNYSYDDDVRAQEGLRLQVRGDAGG